MIHENIPKGLNSHSLGIYFIRLLDIIDLYKYYGDYDFIVIFPTQCKERIKKILERFPYYQQDFGQKARKL